MKMNFKMSYIGLIALIGAVLAIASVFLSWVSIEVINWEISGWGLFDETKGFDQYLYPIIVLVLGIVAAVLAMLEFAGKGCTITRIIMLVVGVLIAVFGFLTYDAFTEGFPDFIADTTHMGYGLYFEFAAAVALIIGPILCFMGVLEE